MLMSVSIYIISNFLKLGDLILVLISSLPLRVHERKNFKLVVFHFYIDIICIEISFIYMESEYTHVLLIKYCIFCIYIHVYFDHHSFIYM